MPKLSCLLHGHRSVSCSFSILIITLPLLLLIDWTRGQESFSGIGSYARYPGWNGLSVSESLLQITFRTSHSDGLIFYGEGRFEGDDENEALEIKLSGGQISFNVRRRIEMPPSSPITGTTYETRSEQFYLSENLNDNRPHTLSLRQSAGTLSVSIIDDPDSEVNSTLLGPASPIGSMELFVGGLPVNMNSLLSTSVPSFVGCFDSVQFTNTSSTPDSLISVLPLEQVGVMEGCTDPCSAVSCGAGTCVAILPSRYYCDCSSTSMGGANCNEDLASHRLSLTLDNYFCYSLETYPFIDRAASVRLIPPLPTSGTIMTGFSERGDYFSVYIDNSLLNFEFVLSNGSRVHLKSNQTLETSTTTYQVNLELGTDQVDLAVSTVSGSSLTEVERMTAATIAPAASGFTTVCAGGTLLELPNYEGVMERVIFNRITLSDSSFMGNVNVESRTDVISFRRDVFDPPLAFERVILSDSLRISFEMRMEQDESLAGTPFEIRNENNFLTFFVLANGRFTPLAFGSAGILNLECPTGQPDLDDNRWHHIDLTFIRNMDGTANFRLIVDYKPSSVCELTEQMHQQALGAFLTDFINSGATIGFGVPKEDANSDMRINFVGCFKNIKFDRDGEDSSMRPDLSLMIRTEERFGSGDTCYGCMEPDLVVCGGNDEVCADCGFNESALCFESGDTCTIGNTKNDSLSTTSVYTDMQTSTYSTVPTTTTTMEETSTTTIVPSTSDEESTTTMSSTSLPVLSSMQIVIYIVVPLCVAAIIIVLVVVVIILLCCCLRARSGSQGFYKTEESNGKVVTMLHYSASLRQIASEQVTMAETNGVSPMHSDGLRPKEFYM